MSTEMAKDNQIDMAAVPPAPSVISEIIYPASVGVRFLHMMVDGVAAYLFAGTVGVLGWLLLGLELGVLLGGLAYLGYYFIFELVFSQTVAKMFTSTKVVSINGEKPTVSALIGRSLARYLPFEVFSFLFYGSYPTKGWHDRLSHTLVVPKHLTPEQVRAIDQEKLGRSGNSAIIFVVILVGLFLVALMGILGAVLLSTVSEVRDHAEKAIESQGSEVASSSEQLDPDVLETIRNEAASYETPQDMGDGVSLNRVFVERNTNALTFEYILENKVADDYDLESAEEQMTVELQAAFCENTPELAYYRENGVTLAWSYYDKNNEHLMTVSSEPWWCEGGV